ncbi:hypothetical protein ACHAQK_001576 [Fusarium lateritium]
MEIASSDSRTWITRADGLLASLIFLEATPPAVNQPHYNAVPPAQQNTESWAVLSDIQIKLEESRISMMTEVAALDFSGLDPILDSFVNPTPFYEAAVGSFRNTFSGTPPNTLGDVVALFSLSQVTSCYLRINGNINVLDIFSDIGIWESAVSDPRHGRAFNDLVQVLRSETVSSDQPYNIPALSVHYPQTPADFSMPSHLVCQEMPPEIPWQYDFGKFSWGPGHSMPEFPVSPILQISSQDEQNDHTALELTLDTPLSGPQAPDLQSLQGSVIITNLTDFLEQCGDLLQVLSGRGVTSRLSSGTSIDQCQSEVQAAIKSSFIQPLQNDKFFVDNLSAQRLLVVADRFVELGYLRSVDETRRYLINVGNVSCRIVTLWHYR